MENQEQNVQDLPKYLQILRPSQRVNTKFLINSLSKYGVGLDASITGAGKTFITCATMKAMGKRLFCLCRATIKQDWIDTAKLFDLPIEYVGSIASVTSKNSPYTSRMQYQRGKKIIKKIEWNLTQEQIANCGFVFDEAHDYCGLTSLNSKLLISAKRKRMMILLLSATLGESPLKLYAPGYVLGLHQLVDFRWWVLKNGCYKGHFGGFVFRKRDNEKYLVNLHNQLFRDKACRIDLSNCDDFPDFQNIPIAYKLNKDNEKMIAEAYDEVEKEWNGLIDENGHMKKAIPITIAGKLFQKSENAKIHSILEDAMEKIEEGCTCVVFANYQSTIDIAEEWLKKNYEGEYGLITGAVDVDDRVKHMQNLKQDKIRLMLVNIKAGGASTSLQDVTGKHPRITYICPTFSAQDLKQALGRIVRTGAKSKCINYICFASDTREEEAYTAVKKKMKNIDLLNDGDLTTII